MIGLAKKGASCCCCCCCCNQRSKFEVTERLLKKLDDKGVYEYQPISEKNIERLNVTSLFAFKMEKRISIGTKRKKDWLPDFSYPDLWTTQFQSSAVLMQVETTDRQTDRQTASLSFGKCENVRRKRKKERKKRVNGVWGWAPLAWYMYKKPLLVLLRLAGWLAGWLAPPPLPLRMIWL